MMELQDYRNVLATLCRQLLSREGNFMRPRATPEHTDDSWSQWITGEAKRRVIYYTWSKHCLPALGH